MCHSLGTLPLGYGFRKTSVEDSGVSCSLGVETVSGEVAPIEAVAGSPWALKGHVGNPASRDVVLRAETSTKQG